MADDHIATGPNSRAEVQFDGSNLIRVGGNSEIHLTELAYGRYQMEFAKGILTYRVFRASNVNAEVDTPTVSVRPSKVGVYRISVGDSGETEVTARLGDVEVFTPRGSQWVNAGQTMMARGTASDPEFQIVSAIPLDEWDHWNETRDRIFLQPSASAQYTDPGNTGMSGTEDLDNNGTWVSVPDYGAVWHPTTVGPGWAPYSAGRWVWEDWYGWTWVSYDPWGWAPYHYGRWFWGAGYGWCWYPGARFGIRSYWSPALVGWFGYGGGVGVGFGFGNIGWVPLAPYEMFHPWWGRGFYGVGAFNRNINISSVNITSALPQRTRGEWRVRDAGSRFPERPFRKCRARSPVSRYGQRERFAARCRSRPRRRTSIIRTGRPVLRRRALPIRGFSAISRPACRSAFRIRPTAAGVEFRCRAERRACDAAGANVKSPGCDAGNTPGDWCGASANRRAGEHESTRYSHLDWFQRLEKIWRPEQPRRRVAGGRCTERTQCGSRHFEPGECQADAVAGVSEWLAAVR